MRLSDDAALGGHVNEGRALDDVMAREVRRVGQIDPESDPNSSRNYRWGVEK